LAFLCLLAAASITGASITVDGGWTAHWDISWPGTAKPKCPVTTMPQPSP